MRNCGLDRKLLAKFNVRKTQFVSFGQSNSICAIGVKMNGFVHEEILSFEMLGLSFSSKLDWTSYVISITTLSVEFLSPEVALYLNKSTLYPFVKDCCHV